MVGRFLKYCWLPAALLFCQTPQLQAEELTFEQHVRPIFKAYCLDCHGGQEEVQAGLDLRLKRFAERGGESGPALVVSQPEASLLVKRLKSGEMPPLEKKVPAEQIALIERWIAQGAKTTREEPEKLPAGIDITPQERAFWAFQPLRRPDLPTFAAADRVRTNIDALILKRLREKNLSFAPDADKRTLLLRAAIDLTGLPPSTEELEAFIASDDANAYEAALDRLLNSPHYGERWGRHWLDAAGYADSDGNGTDDALRPYAYKYRDYVIRALSVDKPLNQFIMEQLAGDELVPLPWNNLGPEQIELLSATGFLRTAIDGTNGAAVPTEAANQVVADTLKIVSTSLLGLSVGCAQCHDHRYDPIPQTDYFRLRAIFEPALNTAQWRGPGQRLVSLYTDADRAKAAAIEAEAAVLQQAYNEKAQKFVLAALEKELLKFPEAMRVALRDAFNTPGDKRTPEQKQLLLANPSVNISPGVLYQYDQPAADELKKDADKIAAKRAEKPVEDYVSLLNEIPNVVPPTHLFHRGDYKQPKQVIAPGDLTIAAPDGQRWEMPAKDAALASSGRRLAFARHLTSGQHPLLGRVLVNRVWMHHFGRGIVDTPGDFGMLGSRPSHPELLDYLAMKLAEQGWSLKRLHKQIMLSTVYRQSSQRRPDQEAVDNENRLLGHFPVQRLDAESIRDRMLLVAGRLDPKQFGPSVAVAEDFVGQVLPENNSTRRSIYLQVRRTKPVSLLTAFDLPVMTVNCERRVASTTSLQSLMLMNSEFVMGQATAIALRVREETKSDFAASLTAPLAARFIRPAEAWSYGYGQFDAPSQRTSFTALPHWTGGAWQGGTALPDAAVGWSLLNAQGGHTSDLAHTPIRRWVAPQPGVLVISGKLRHSNEPGDGVRGRILSSRNGLIGEWKVLNSEAATNVERVAVQAGDTIDFATDCVGDVNCDSFQWPVDLKLVNEAGAALGTWNSESQFHGPAGASLPQLAAQAWRLAYQRLPSEAELEAACVFLVQQLEHMKASNTPGDHELPALTNLCQQLISSNEFLYVD